MTCWRQEIKGEKTHCDELCALVMDTDDDGEQVFCLGIIQPDKRDLASHSKRFCLASDGGGTDQAPDIQLDLTDVDVAALQSTLAGGLLGAYQRARVMLDDEEE